MLFLVENLEIIDNIINKDIFYIDCFDKLKQLLWLNILSIFPPKKIKLKKLEEKNHEYPCQSTRYLF